MISAPGVNQRNSSYANGVRNAICLVDAALYASGRGLQELCNYANVLSQLSLYEGIKERSHKSDLIRSGFTRLSRHV